MGCAKRLSGLRIAVVAFYALAVSLVGLSHRPVAEAFAPSLVFSDGTTIPFCPGERDKGASPGTLCEACLVVQAHGLIPPPADVPEPDAPVSRLDPPHVLADATQALPPHAAARGPPVL